MAPVIEMRTNDYLSRSLSIRSIINTTSIRARLMFIPTEQMPESISRPFVNFSGLDSNGLTSVLAGQPSQKVASAGKFTFG
jgi:hypothetical protein